MREIQKEKAQPASPMRWGGRLGPRSLAAGIAAVILALGIVAIRQSGPRTSSAWAAALVKIADGAPRLLVTEDGWNVVRADEFSGDMGEMTFANGAHHMDLSWMPADAHEEILKDRMNGAGTSWDVTIAGRQAVLIQYEGTNIFTALWREGDHSLELRGAFPGLGDYRAVATSIDAVDIDTWLSAMPESVVQPAVRAATIDGMLADVPVHPSVDVKKLKTSGRVSDRYQLGAQVTSPVVCAWMEQWVDSTAKEEDDRAQEAVEAMATSHNWAILREMDDEGAWPEVVWEYADAMPNNDSVSGGGPLTIKEGYRETLGCEGAG